MLCYDLCRDGDLRRVRLHRLRALRSRLVRLRSAVTEVNSYLGYSLQEADLSIWLL